MVSLVRGRHAIKFGGRLRVYGIDNTSQNNFNGTFTFGGGEGVLLNPDFTPVLGPDGKPVLGQITSHRTISAHPVLPGNTATLRNRSARLSGGATQFSLAAGNPLVGFRPVDGGVYVQDDWRMKPSLTLSFGLRYELQNYLSDWSDFGAALRLRVGAGHPAGQDRQDRHPRRVRHVLRPRRIGPDPVHLRYNGTNQQQYIDQQSGLLSQCADVEQLSGLQPQTVQTFNPDLKAPYLMQIALGVERQLPRSTTVAVNYTGTRGVHDLRSQLLPVNGSDHRDHLRTTSPTAC